MHIAVIGAGRMGMAHIETLASLPGVGELSIADRDADRARVAADQVAADRVAAHGVPRVRAVPVDAALAEGANGLVIVAPTSEHADLVIRAIDSGIPVFCEKPVAENVSRTRLVVERWAGATVPVQIGFQRRFDPGYVSARAVLQAGDLGSLRRVHLVTGDPKPPAAEYIPTSGGIFRDCSVHDFDILRWVTGLEADYVFAAGVNRGAEFFGAAGDVDEAVAVIGLADGTLATLQASRYNGAGYDVRMELAGTRAQITVGLDDRTPIRSAEAGVPFPTGQPWPDFQSRFRTAYRREMETFLEVAAGTVPSPCTPQDALAALYIAEAADLSRREHRPVTLAEVGAPLL
jgi:myo-inositol 2-dehydrogenase/D-chiro-inositol 1-dehydrogenase